MGRFIKFSLYAIEPITEAAALAHQNGKGYNPMGYGFYSFKVSRCFKDGREYFEATWQCAASCD